MTFTFRSIFIIIVSFQQLRFYPVASSINNNVTQRKRFVEHHYAAVSDIMLATFGSVSETLEELWARETAIAEIELERQLLGLTSSSLSMTTPAPIQLPISLAPIDSPTTSPTILDDNCLNGRTPQQYLLDTLVEITSVDILLNPTTPQGRAFSFLLNDTLVGEDVCMYSTIEQRYGLGTLSLFANRPEMNVRPCYQTFHTVQTIKLLAFPFK
jgi:hypothetical protein